MKLFVFIILPFLFFDLFIFYNEYEYTYNVLKDDCKCDFYLKRLQGLIPRGGFPQTGV